MVLLRELLTEQQNILVDTPRVDSFVPTSSLLEPIPALRIQKTKQSERPRRLRRLPESRRTSLPSRWAASIVALDEADTMLTTRRPVRKTQSETVERSIWVSPCYRRSTSMDASPILPTRRAEWSNGHSSGADHARSKSSDCMPILPMRRSEVIRQSSAVLCSSRSEEAKSPSEHSSQPSPSSREIRFDSPSGSLSSSHRPNRVERDGRNAFEGTPPGYDCRPIMPKRKEDPTNGTSGNTIKNQNLVLCSPQA